MTYQLINVSKRQINCAVLWSQISSYLMICWALYSIALAQQKCVSHNEKHFYFDSEIFRTMILIE